MIEGDDALCLAIERLMGVYHNVLYTMGFERVKITPVKDVRLIVPLPSRMDDIELKWTILS